MEAHAEHSHHHHHHHHHHEDVEVNPASWTDGKRYAWLLGSSSRWLLHRLGLGRLTGWGTSGSSARCSSSAPSRSSTSSSASTPSNPPDSVLKWLEQDRYYRWCTYLFIPIQYAGLVFACWLWSSGDLWSVEPRSRAHHRRRQRHRHQHRTRARPQARELERWLAESPSPRPATGTSSSSTTAATTSASRRPRTRPARGSARASGRSCRARSSAACVRLGPRSRAPDRLGKSHWSLQNDILIAWAMTVVLFAALAIVFGPVVLPSC